MAKTLKTACHSIVDSDEVIAMIRCPEGDTAAYTRLLREHLDYMDLHVAGINERTDEYTRPLTLKPPRWQWLRVNPCSPNLCGEHGWHYGYGKAGQRGAFMGVLVETTRDGA